MTNDSFCDDDEAINGSNSNSSSSGFNEIYTGNQRSSDNVDPPPTEIISDVSMELLSLDEIQVCPKNISNIKKLMYALLNVTN